MIPTPLYKKLELPWQWSQKPGRVLWVDVQAQQGSTSSPSTAQAPRIYYMLTSHTPNTLSEAGTAPTGSSAEPNGSCATPVYNQFTFLQRSLKITLELNPFFHLFKLSRSVFNVPIVPVSANQWFYTLLQRTARITTAKKII